MVGENCPKIFNLFSEILDKIRRRVYNNNNLEWRKIMTNYFEQTVKSISESIRFDSSPSKSTSALPFGKGCADCLAHFLTLAQSLGFQTKNYGNYVGEVIFGEGEPFAILAHLDVVPAGSGWTKAPFGGEVSDGKIWGRGAIDDKGPAMCVLYAMKALKDEGFVPSRQIKFIVGCNEESGWACIEHYNEVAEMPAEGFSPDGSFPVIYAEKGILHVRLHFPMGEKPPFFFLEGGTSANMVCDECSATPRTLTLTRAREMGLEIRNKKLTAHGTAAHGSTPELGKNAILPILRFFEEKSPQVKNIIECLFEDKFRLTELEDETGKLTLSPNMIKYRKGEVQVICDIRYPATVPYAEVVRRLGQIGVKYETIHHQPPLMQDKESPLVQTLLGAFTACTGKAASPIAIGGGTYARALKNGVAFGPEMADDEPVMHRADEYITLERVQLLLDVYKRAIRDLTRDLTR